jgi:hypothetical protein
MDYQVKDNNCSFFYHCEWLLRQHESGHFLTYGHFMSRPTAFHCRTPDLYWHFFTVYKTYQFKRNPNTIPVSKIICTCSTIFLKFYNKCVNKNESGHHSSSCWYYFYHVIFYVATSKGQHWNRIWVTTDTQRWQCHQYF